MKKKVLIIMSLLLVFVLAACSGKNAGNNNSSNNSGASDSVKATDKAGGENASSGETSSVKNQDTAGGKVLVVYYSATGNTKEAADYIAAATGGDTFELVPAKQYSQSDLNYNDKNSRVVYEHDNPDKRDIALKASTVENFNEYDTIFIGYPIWWGIAAWPVDGFIKANDFTGKTVIPFCTSASSGLGGSGELLKKAAGTGNWLEGVRFSSNVSETQVKEWLKSIGY